MYIDEVITKAQSYFPSEYDKKEMYAWCDEVSAMISVEDKDMPCEHIRVVSYRGEGVVDNVNSQIAVNSKEFVKGDRVAIKVGEVSLILDVADIIPQADGSVLQFGDGEVDALSDFADGEIDRVVTDKTLCDAPYDGMYIDYLIAKVCLYQRDFNTYNQFMSAFNSRLSAYKRWSINRPPNKDGKLKNWWRR